MRSIVILALLGAGCGGWPRPRVPMASIATPHEHGAETLIVFLPGRKDRARVFVKDGFFDVVARHGLHDDLIAADAHAGYYARGDVVERLHHDVIAPALRRHGYQRLILVGVSLGGYGAIRYAMKYPVDTLILLSPFLGAGALMKELAAPGDPDFAETWAWLEKGPHPRILLGFGEEDMLLSSDRRLQNMLPVGDVVTAPGFHDWGAWRKLFDRLLAL